MVSYVMSSTALRASLLDGLRHAFSAVVFIRYAGGCGYVIELHCVQSIALPPNRKLQLTGKSGAGPARGRAGPAPLFPAAEL